MKFLICPDSFKDCIDSVSAATVISNAIHKIIPSAHIMKIPLSDGGQGFIKVLQSVTSGTKITAIVSNPLGKKISASYLLTDDNHTAIIEMAQASGLELLHQSERNPAITTTFGVGELILHAINNYPIHKIIIGIGGSATNDGGAGMLQALGAQFLDHNNQLLALGGIHLAQLKSMKLNKLDCRLSKIDIKIASDVTNPLTGINGASKVYAWQKGADSVIIEKLEAALTNYQRLIQQTTGIDFSDIPGAGAAGGLGAGLLLLGGKIIPGLEVIAKYTHLEQWIQETDYVISGEGSIDEQTINGKTISKLAGYCHKYNKMLIIVCGRSHGNLEPLYAAGVTAIFTINTGAYDLNTALANGAQNLARCSENIARLLSLHNKK